MSNPQQQVENGEMTRYEAYDDIGPSAPSHAEIARRIRSARDQLAVAEERLRQGEPALAIGRLERAAIEARGGKAEEE